MNPLEVGSSFKRTSSGKIWVVLATDGTRAVVGRPIITKNNAKYYFPLRWALVKNLLNVKYYISDNFNSKEWAKLPNINLERTLGKKKN